MKYRFIGTAARSLEGQRRVEPGQIVEVEKPINSPLFEPVGDDENKKSEVKKHGASK